MVSAKGYDDLIMDHIRNARNFHALDDATHSANGSNLLCGDELAVHARIAGELIENVSFQCTCCGISMASASMMAESVKGKRIAEVRIRLAGIVASLAARAYPAGDDSDPMQHALLKTVQELPARTRCAMLPWVTLEAALDKRQDTVFVR